MTAANPESIMDSIKQALGVGADNDAFDIDIMIYINAVFGSLLQIGAGPSTGFLITDNSTLWSDYTNRTDVLGLIKSFMTLKVKFMFDPSSNRYAIAAVESIMAEYEWRIRLAFEQPFIPPPSTWWDVSGLSDFPAGAVVGDLGIDWGNGALWVNGASTTSTSNSFFWDLTGLSDFPTGASFGDLGIDLSTGDVWIFSQFFPSPASWWDVTDLSDFPSGAVVGDLGIDWSTGDLWVDGSRTTSTSNAFFWDLTGLSDFPMDASVGDLGIDMSTGDVWRFSQ